MRKFVIFAYFICCCFIFGCEKSKEINHARYPTFVALADGDSKLIFLDKKMNIVKEINNKNKFQSFSIDGNRVYALEDGTYTGTKPSMLIMNLSNGYIERKIKLPHIPAAFVVVKQKAYIASSEIFREGMPFFIVNLSNGKIEKLMFTKGMVNTIKHYKDEIFISINSGGSMSQHSNVYRIQTNDASLSFHPVIQDHLELPPSDFVIEDNKMYCVFTGFSYGPRPEWVKDPEKYTNRFMVIDLNNGKIIYEKKLSKPFPQKIISVGNKFYINNYTDMDMKGKFLTIINKKDFGESFLPIKNPAYFDYNKQLKGFLVSNPQNGTLQFMKNGKIVKKLKVGENSSIVKSVQK
ncbi:hypothetical protein GFC29_50 [Anoxybacillus sp. B7M1]|uniref:Lipoprotein n=2 Tax=Anoxybacillaceae TaxID=3120669 RepID=A0ABT5W6E2_9BACL|nr:MULTISPECIES: hypothetical protein [Anoxybacillus]ANB58774.1 hypothetical protein GFC28_1578 [Anoxybacillus sp. B2M1]ANB64368.1 hypothetical protein GFC29_50 [Anoxybacillus sp. B7M1]KXG09163.1 hypothetical protein AT864_02628 [Anoxybacillus sp. P3H1B]MBB3908719.1 hypothetical protein [Anoxybacillus rupiensis]MDE8564868.1 hypothetical protein [Anoxybacillus rupiensis]